MKIIQNLNYLAFFSLLLAGIEGKAVTQQINLTPPSTHGVALRVPRPATQPKSILELVAAAIVVYVMVFVVVYAVLSSIEANEPAPVEGTVEYVVEYLLQDLHTRITRLLKLQVTPQTKISFRATIEEVLGPIVHWGTESESLEYLMQRIKTELCKRHNQVPSWSRGIEQHVRIKFELQGVLHAFRLNVRSLNKNNVFSTMDGKAPSSAKKETIIGNLEELSKKAPKPGEIPLR